MTISRDERDQLRKLASRATPGPWVVNTCEPCAKHGHEDIQIWDERGRFLIAQWMDEADPDAGDDAEFIATARTAVPALLDALDNAERQIKAVRDVHYPVQGIHGPLVCAHRSCVDDAMDQCEWPCATIRAIEGDA